jgi:amino acid transporter
MSTQAEAPQDAPAPSPTSYEAPEPRSSKPSLPLPPDTFGYRMKRRLLGRPMHSEQLEHERLGKPTALAVFASDNLSSSAYATEEILHVLVPYFGLAAFALVLPLTGAMLIVLALLIISYRETIKEYPSAGGAYLVTRDNFGIVPAQVAGAALLIGYILTVAVSVAAGSAAIASTIDALDPWRVPLSLFFIALIAYGNLRGVRESGKIFAAPTYFFMVNMAILIGWGIVSYTSGDLPTLGVF